MEIRPEIVAAFDGKVGWSARNGARKISEELEGKPIELALRAYGSVKIMAVTPEHVTLIDSQLIISVWPLEHIKSVRWSKSTVLGTGRMEISGARATLAQSVSLSIEGLDAAIELFTRRLGDKVQPLEMVQPNDSAGPRPHGAAATQQRSPNASSPAPAPEGGRESTSQATRTFDIHALGPSGSGKTVFMASLYHKLRLRRPELAFYLKSDHDSSVHLNAVYNQIASPTDQWPEASQGVNEWTFNACVQTPSGDYEPLRFRYLDYPGGVLTNPRGLEDESIQTLVKRLRGANALLILLDGQAMKALLEDGPLGQRYMAFDITSSLEIAQQSRCPVHFVVTKWDVLEGGYTLEQVRDRLLADENFRDLIAAKSQDTPATIRLIPVSAVGSGFAELSSSGLMKKVGAPVRPHNVELPLLSVMPDSMLFAHAEVHEHERQLAARGKTTLSDALLKPDLAARWQPAVTDVARRASPKLRQLILTRYPRLAPLLSEEMFSDAIGYGARLMMIRTARAHAGRQRYAAELMDARNSVDSQRAAVELLERQCSEMILRFEEDMPASVLAGGLSEQA